MAVCSAFSLPLTSKMHDALAMAVPLLKHRGLGAQVLQAGLGDLSGIFYLSPLCWGAMAAVPARGGVPVLFPQFADTGLLPKHGLVRTAQWELLEEQVAQGSHSLRYGLEILQNDYPTWPHAAKLSLVAKVTPDALCFELRVANTGNCSFSWTGGLHPYFGVQDVLQSSLSGLSGLGVRDRYAPDLKCQPAGDITWTRQPFERLYAECPPLTLNMGSYSLHLSASGFDQWMVWNPGEEGGNALTDLPAGDWRHFVCVEPVCVTRPVVLAPGATFEGSLRIVKA
jgi:glucose-6-phosphate 1-epimerase